MNIRDEPGRDKDVIGLSHLFYFILKSMKNYLKYCHGSVVIYIRDLLVMTCEYTHDEDTIEPKYCAAEYTDEFPQLSIWNLESAYHVVDHIYVPKQMPTAPRSLHVCWQGLSLQQFPGLTLLVLV